MLLLPTVELYIDREDCRCLVGFLGCRSSCILDVRGCWIIRPCLHVCTSSEEMLSSFIRKVGLFGIDFLFGDDWGITFLYPIYNQWCICLKRNFPKKQKEEPWYMYLLSDLFSRSSNIDCNTTTPFDLLLSLSKVSTFCLLFLKVDFGFIGTK